jgi:hypothetical protein
MPRRHLAALLIALAALSEPVAAELRGSPEEPPVFTAAEVAIIARNAVLSSLVQDNPWLVRHLLDALATAARVNAAANPPPGGGAKVGPGAAAPDTGKIDPRANPDLDELQRTSPEGALDLFRILKQAAPDKPPPKRN